MTVRPTIEKCTAWAALCRQAFRREEIKIEDAASVAGKIVFMFPGAQFRQLHYWELEKEKAKALKSNRINWKAKMTEYASTSRVRMVAYNVHKVYGTINKGSYDMILSSDASGLGWSISDGKTEGRVDGIAERWWMLQRMKSIIRSCGRHSWVSWPTVQTNLIYMSN